MGAVCLFQQNLANFKKSYKINRDDEVVLTDEESSNSDDEDEDAKIFWIETNVFDFETPLCRRFEMIKYSFRQDEEYVAVKEDEYEDLTSTSKDACQAYQEIFRMMDEGWMVTRAE
ncbi:hypothetical protein Tco_1209442 [Tanacetum coccineum]